jgi:hypothetical protein
MDRIIRTALDMVGLSSSPSKPTPKPSPKRPASGVLHGQAKRAKQFVETPKGVYYNAPYVGVGVTTLTDLEDEEGYSYASQIATGPQVDLTPKGVKTKTSIKTKAQTKLTLEETRRKELELKKEYQRKLAGLKKGGQPIEVETICETPTRITSTVKKPKRQLKNMPSKYADYPTKEKWKLHPTIRARELSDPEKIRAEVQEPEYALCDAEIRDGMWQIMDQMETFTKQYFGLTDGVKVGKDGVVSADFYKDLSPETAKVIGCVASGGPSGTYGWHNLFIDEQKRRALVMAIIGNVLTEQVFQHLLFGGTDRQIAAMIKLEEEYKDSDGKFSHHPDVPFLPTNKHP